MRVSNNCNFDIVSEVIRVAELIFDIMIVLLVALLCEVEVHNRWGEGSSFLILDRTEDRRIQLEENKFKLTKKKMKN